MTRSNLFYGAALSAALGLAPLAAFAAGPCSDDIAQLGKQLGNMSGLGAPISEKTAGLQQGQGTSQMASAAPDASDHSQPGGASRAGGGSAGTVGGVAGAVGSASGAKEQNAVATGQVATSSADVRRQSEGKPTMAQQAAAGPGSSADTANDDKTSQAKAALQRAVDLNAKGDGSCAAAVQEAKALMPTH